jgi:ribosomal-protein-alanine N-acetyltransferase
VFDAPLVVPELRSGPVLLRPFALCDLPLIRHAATDPHIAAATSVPSVYSDAAGRAFLDRQRQRAVDGDGYSFAIADAANPARGLGGLGLWLREIDSGRASIGYWVAPSARSRRYAGWGLRGAVTFAFAVLAIPRLQIFVEPWNIASQRTAVFAGFAQEALLRGWERIGHEQHDVFSYALLRQEWTPYVESEWPGVTG